MKVLSIAQRIPLWVPRDVLLPVFLTRAMLILVAWLGFQLCPKEVLPNIGAWEISWDGKQKPISDHISPNAHPFINMWARWDSHWYLSIAKHGYEFKPDAGSNSAFFPLYPRLMRLLHHFISLHNDAGWMLAGIIISNVSLIVAFCYLFLLIRMDFDEKIAARVILYMSIFPATLFLSAVYTESLFLALVAAAFYCARNNRWLVASLLGAVAARCRPTGFLLVIPLAIEYCAQKDFRWREIKIDMLLLALIPLGLFAHMADLRFRFGSWNIIAEAQGTFGCSFALPTTTVWKFLTNYNPVAPLNIAKIDFGFLVCFVALAVYGAFRLRLSYTIYAAVSLVFITMWGLFNSASRYGLVIFPLFIALALLGKNQYFDRFYLIVSSMLAAFFMLLFSQWGWVA